MKSKSIVRFVVLALALNLIFTGARSPLLALQAEEVPRQESVEESTGLWVVQLAEPSLATYPGNINGLAATTPQVTGARKLDVNAPASIAYRSFLASRQNEFRGQMNQVLNRPVEVQFQYLNVINGLAVRVSADEAARLAELPQVVAVYRDTLRHLDTDVSHDLIGSAAIWDGETGKSMATRGEGIIVGMLDTGVNPDHPSFAATDGDGYTHTNPYGSGNFVGVCDPGAPNHEDICNDKLIGAWNFHPNSPSAQDWNDHGSHVGSTIAGNKHEAVFAVGPDVFTRTIQGVAPRANVISYLVCFPTCPETSSVAAVDQAVADGVDVLNYSITGVDNPWNDLVDLAFLEGFNAGIFIAASAGNDGPGAGTVAKTGPWNASVAASTHNRIIANTLDATEPAPVPPTLVGMGAVPGTGPAIVADIEAEIRYAGLVDPGNERGCNAFPPGSFIGSMALIQRGDCTFAVKVNNATAAGAGSVVVFNHLGGPPITMGGLEGTVIPAVFIDRGNGNELRDFIVANAPTPSSARINAGASVVTNDEWQDIMAGFSSRGPSQFEMLAPTFTAPGVNILAAGAALPGEPVRYVFLQGTSLASPHGAGSGALMVALHPNWTPAEIRSALASSADRHTILKEDAETPADPFDMGSGRLNLDKAGRVGLVLDETYANFVAANPALGGDPKTLNIPGMVNMECVDTCTWTRTLKSVATVAATYTAVVAAPPGMSVTVTPSSFTLVPGTQNGATQQVEITADVSGLPEGAWAFAEVRFETDARHPNHGDFVQLAEASDLMEGWAQHTLDLSAYAGQDVCLAFAYKGFDAHNWAVDDILVTSDAGTHIDESFTATEFPPPGWTRHDFDGVGQQWLRTTATFNTSPASARHAFSTVGGVVQDGWLVTPQFTLGDNGSLTFFDHTGFPAWYMYSGVWISTGSCDPTPGAGEPIAPVHYPIAVIPVAEAPAMTLDPEEITSVQGVDEIVTHILTIGNVGGADLLWNVVEDEPELTPFGRTTQVTTIDVPSQLTTIGDVTLSSNRNLDAEVGAIAEPEAPPAPESSVTITHSASQAVVAGNSVACSPDGGFTTTENGYLRTFTLEDFGIFSDFDVTQVSFGIESLSGVPQTMTVNLFTLDAMPFIYANMTLIGTASATFNPQALTIVTVPVTGNVPAGATLVVEVDAPNMSGVGGFFIGSNSAGQTAPSYLRSASCGLPEPRDVATIGFPNMHIVMNVTGFAEPPACDVPTGTPWVDVTPLSGTVSPGTEQEVSVTFDSTGLTMGEHTANLCLESNDPARPFAVVPLTLIVEQIPAIEVSPESLAATQPANTVTSQTVSISNVGEGILDWHIEEAEPEGMVLSDNPLRTVPGDLPSVEDLMRDYESVPLANVILDGGFEAGTPNPFWDEGSTNFGTPLCTVGTCGTGGGTGPRTGSWWAWFGGINAVETGFVRQTVSLDTGAAELSFWLEIPAASGTGNDFLNVSLGGAVIFSVTDADQASYATYSQVVVDVSAFAGGTHELSFDATVFGGGTTNFFVDDVALDSQPPSGPCSMPTDVPWLSVAPASGSTAAGESDEVTVTFDSTGLVADTYEALLCVNSNDPANPLVEVPVTLEVLAEPMFQKLVNAGGGLYIDGAGNEWVPDQVYVAGDWGYTNHNAPRGQTNRMIAGTDDPVIYQTVRQNPREFRFDGLAPGTYEVRLLFAEIQNRQVGTRVFDVIINDQVVLPAYDITARVGNFHADEHSFMVTVGASGQLSIRFFGRQGAPPIINALGVIQQP
jgi:hypothetical protein